MPSPTSFYSDREVYDAINNAVIAVTRWHRYAPEVERSPNRLSEFARAIRTMIDEAVNTLSVEDGVAYRAFTPVEVLAALQTCAGMVLVSDILPDEGGARKSFIASLRETRRPEIVPIREVK